MSRWLSTASIPFGRQPADAEPEPFSVTCGCGENVNGVRIDEFQKVRCGKCGNLVFVLPENTYPEPSQRTSRKKKQRTSAKKQLDIVRIIATELSRLGNAIGNTVVQTVRRLVQRTVFAIAKAIRRFLGIFTAFRVAVLVILAIIGGTGYWTFQQSARENAETTLKSAIENGREALREEEFFAAAVELRKAVAALDILGRDDAEAQAVRQLLREATAASDLAAETPFEILTTVMAARQTDPTGWEEDFQNRFANRWIVMEATVVAFTDAQGNRQVVVECPVLLDKSLLEFEVNLSAFGDLILGDADTSTAVFAGQLKSCRWVGPEPGVYQVTLVAGSTFLWSNYENYRALGFGLEEDEEKQRVQQLLGRQSQIIGLEP